MLSTNLFKDELYNYSIEINESTVTIFKELIARNTLDRYFFNELSRWVKREIRLFSKTPWNQGTLKILSPTSYKIVYNKQLELVMVPEINDFSRFLANLHNNNWILGEIRTGFLKDIDGNLIPLSFGHLEKTTKRARYTLEYQEAIIVLGYPPSFLTEYNRYINVLMPKPFISRSERKKR